MPRPRVNDPSNLLKQPNYTTDPVRQREIEDKFIRRLALVKRNYLAAREFYGHLNRLNDSLSKLRTARGRGDCDVDEQMLHPEIRLLIGHLETSRARQCGDIGPPTPADKAAAIDKVLSDISARRGRPTDAILFYHVKAVVAAVQEAVGLPVMATRHKQNVYDPQAANPSGQTVIHIFRGWDPDLSVTTLVNAIEKVRVQFAGRDLYFDDEFPAALIQKITPY